MFARLFLMAMLPAALVLGGCAHELRPSLDYYMKEKKTENIAIEKFPHCKGYGCPIVENVVLNQHDWSIIWKSYGKAATTPEQERQKIAKTIGVFEQVAGPITKTQNDVEGTFLKTGEGQLDCVDESTNTTIYMLLLEQKGLLKFHDIMQPQVRWPIVSGRGWMHQTAVIVEKGTKKAYAVDSWFENNGKPAWIVPLDAWRNGWHPDQLENSQKS